MSVAEFPGQHPTDDYPAQLDRTPPQDQVAEQSVLGAMLMSKDAIADVVESVRGTDFYRPTHETVFDAIIDLYGRGEPADAVTVAAQLQRQGDLGRVGGAPYLHTLVSGVPIAANAGYYAEIVREKAILRRLVDAGTRIAQWGYSGEGDVDDVVDRAQAEVYGVTDKRTSEDYAPLADIMEGTLDEIEAISNRDGAMVGVPTGFADLDELTNGLHPGQMVIVAARPAMGKALALDTPLPTPDGWTTMGAVRVGDDLVGADGRATRVLAATEVMDDRECYEVCFSDGTSIVADAQHQWAARLEGRKESSVSTTEHWAKLTADGTTPWVDSTRRMAEIRRTASVPVRCVQVDAHDHLYLAGPSKVPTHNSTLGLDIARSAAIKHGMASVIFSLEMSRNEITMRLLSAEARIALNSMRNGHMNDDDWSRLARKMGEVSSAPLFIDDSPNMTMMEIRAKARRLKQRHDLRMVIVDYLQLMQSGKRVESRQLEVSEFSRQLKLLAKELEVPVIAISQLNRGAEQRTDRRPMLSDLRESGCLTADTRLMRADTNAEITLGELMANDVEKIPVWALDDRLKLVPRTLTHAFPSGVKEVFRLRLSSGREVKATANHRFLTYDGWKRLDDLTPGARIGSLRHVPPPLEQDTWDDDEVTLLAHLVGGGSFGRRQPVRYCSTDEANRGVVAEAVSRRFGITAVADEHAAAAVPSLRLPAPRTGAHGRNPVAAWLDDLRLVGLHDDERFVPGAVFALSKQQVGLFLRHLWATGGSVRWDSRVGKARVSFSSTSRRLVDDIARLLLRYNVFSWVKRTHRTGQDDLFHLHVNGVENQLRFCEEIGVHGERGEAVAEVARILRTLRSNTRVDTVPGEVWSRVREVLRDRHMTHRQFATPMGTRLYGSPTWVQTPSRARMAKVAAVLNDADLEVLATNDVFWDSVVSIEPLGERDVYDATVLGMHNFVADGIAAHNSLEQDADMVVLIHREDAYERESTRPGEADLIVAKHRNGPTATVVVAFQGHYSRFVDMAH